MGPGCGRDRGAAPPGGDLTSPHSLSRQRRPLRRRDALAVLAAGAWMTAWAREGESALPRPVSLPEEARRANRRGDPLVVLVSLPDCPYCERVRRDWLLPLQREWDGGVVQLDLGSDRRVIGFDGSPGSHQAVLRAWKAGFAPTVLWFGADGQELAPRLVGAGLPDFYGAYFQERLETARRQLR